MQTITFDQNAAVALGTTLIFLLKVTCLVLGYLVVKLGHGLLTSGVKGEFKFQAEWSGLRADLASASPGLLFLLLGILLMGYAIGVSKIVEVGGEPGRAGSLLSSPSVELPEKGTGLSGGPDED